MAGEEDWKCREALMVVEVVEGSEVMEEEGRRCLQREEVKEVLEAEGEVFECPVMCCSRFLEGFEFDRCCSDPLWLTEKEWQQV